jgi:hypothetical protein
MPEVADWGVMNILSLASYPVNELVANNPLDHILVLVRHDPIIGVVTQATEFSVRAIGRDDEPCDHDKVRGGRVACPVAATDWYGVMNRPVRFRLLEAGYAV